MNNVTSYVQYVHRRLTRMPAVACVSLQLRSQCLPPVKLTRSTELHFKTRELLLAFVAAYDKAPSKLIFHWIDVG